MVISNQGGLTLNGDPKAAKANAKRISDFKRKVTTVFAQLDMPLSIYGATDKDRFRKPRVGMWMELTKDLKLDPSSIDLENSIFVGDAAGRTAILGAAKDFSSTDRYITNLLLLVSN